jgi:hypothetical protein
MDVVSEPSWIHMTWVDDLSSMPAGRDDITELV